VSANVSVAAGTQTVTMTQLADAYSPADTTVYAGIPIRWVIESEAPYTCAAFLRVPDLGVKADLTLGTNTVDLPALNEGTTPFSCSMGMYSGTLTAISPPA
jgi:plastocyanin domain-containing protein